MLRDLDAEAIANVVKFILQSGLSARLIALGANGASVMSGCNSSVFTKLKKEYPCTLYVHCACHRLNLIVVGLFKSCKVFDCLFSVIRKLHEIFSVSKYKIILECQQRELYTSSSDRVMEIQAIKEVRWEIKFLVVQCIEKRIKAIILSLQIIAMDNNTYSDCAAGLYHKIMSGKFILKLTILYNFLLKFYDLSKYLQSPQVYWSFVLSEIKIIKLQLSELTCENIINDAKKTCEDIGIILEYEDPLFLLSRPNSDDNIEQETEKILSKVIEILIKESNHRFSEYNINILQSIEAMKPLSNQYLDWDLFSPLAIHYNPIFSFNFELVRNECEKVRIMVKNGIQFDINMYENLKKIIVLINTIPVTTASVERSFSTMNRVISWVRNSIDKERASNLILLSVEKE